MRPTKSVCTALVLALVAVLGLGVVGIGSVAAQTDDPGAGSDRVVEDGERVFLNEDNIDTDAGVFENLNPGAFRNGDGNTLSITDGFVEPENAARTYTTTDPETGEELSIIVREARIQRIRPINARSGARLDFPGTPRVRPGENNLQVAVDYNYYESTEIDEELRQDGSEVTRLYLEESQDRANTGSEVTAADGTRYDAVFTFSITDSGEYEFVAGPLTGDDRPDGRDIGFDNGEEDVGSSTVNVASDETRDDGEDEEDGEEGDDVENGEDEDGNVTDGDDRLDDDMDREDGDRDEEDEGDGEDGNVTDGEDGTVDGNETGDGKGDGEDGEGMPGFTVVTALVALATAAVVAVRQEA